MKTLATTLAAAVAVAFAGFAHSASATPTTPLGCGAVVTTDVKLGSDLLDCPGAGLIVGSDDITIDLAGHVVGGDAVPGTSQTDIGILLDGHTGVTVTGGSIRGFDIGVLLVRSSENRLQHLKIHDITGKAVILDHQARNNTVTENALTHNGNAGVGVFNGSDHNVFSKNFLSDDGPQGIENLFADSNVITQNVITRTGSGVILESSDDLRITENVITHSVPTACDGCGIAVQIYGNRNLVAGNTLIDSPRYGIEVDDFQDPGHSPATGNVLRDNRVVVAGIGIAIGPEAGGLVSDTLIRKNVVSNAADDGIDLVGPSAVEASILASNHAEHNGGFGIEAVPGTIDGGGNQAAGNGNPLQCLNVACR
jgi:nitrous oxidase accessory protein NosD